MKVIIAGSRTINDYKLVKNILNSSKLRFTEVVSGHAQGVDLLGERWADERDIPVTEMPADWKKWGKAAGPKRNRQMAEYADALVLIWDGKSKGSANMLSVAIGKKLVIEEYVV